MNVRMESVSKRWGSVIALNNVSVEFPEGAISVVLGPNGAGKTTLLLCMTGVVIPNRGEIYYDDQLFSRKRIDLRRRMGLIPDAPFFFARSTPLQHVAMLLHIYEVDRPGYDERVADIFDALDLLEVCEAPIKDLSRGQQYKTALAGLLAVDPEVWVLDEPVASGIDAAALRFFKDEARDAAERGRTVIYSTQLASVAEEFSDRFCLLHEGKVVAVDDVSSLRPEAVKDSALEEIVAKLRE